MIDTHAHLGVCEPPNAELVAEARRVGVERILTIGLDEDSNRGRPGRPGARGLFAAVGRHPNSADGFDDAAADAIEALAAEPSSGRSARPGSTSTATGPPRRTRCARSRRRSGSPAGPGCRWSSTCATAAARAPGAPSPTAIELLAAEAAGVEVILHCFSATAERAEEAAERGWHVSFAGNVTYPKSEELREARRA